MSVTTSNPNPQPVTFAFWESPTLAFQMAANGSIAGMTFQLNIRDLAGNIVLSLNPATITTNGSATTQGTYAFTLTSAQAGALAAAGVPTTTGNRDLLYDSWRVDSGFEKRLAYGPLAVKLQQWK